MPNLSLPFINALLLAVLWLRVFSQRHRDAEALGSLLFIGICALATVLVGLRWSGNFPAGAIIQPLVAAALPVVCWYCLRGQRKAFSLVHMVPVVVIGIGLTMRNIVAVPLVDIALTAIYLGYGTALLRAAGPNGRSSWLKNMRQRGAVMGVMLIISGLLDAVVALDFGLDQGKNAVHLVAGANLLLLLIVAAIITRTTGAAPAIAENGSDTSPPPPAAPTEDDHRRIAQLDHLMQHERLFMAPDLTLVRLAKRLGLPARQLSEAINRVHGRNISQIINEYRVGEAIRLLSETDQKITDIMMSSGFQTKSNFNREFRRVTGVNPSEYRQSRVLPLSAQEPLTPELTTAPKNH